MIGANAVATEMAIQMLDKYDLSEWKFAGEDSSGSQVRVLVVPPNLPPATGYFVMVSVDQDTPLAGQLDKAIEQLKDLWGGSVPEGQTPDDKLDGFFAGLNMPPEVAAGREQQVKMKRQAPPKEEASPSS